MPSKEFFAAQLCSFLLHFCLQRPGRFSPDKTPHCVPMFSSIEEDFMNWRDSFWPMLCEQFGIEATGEEVR